jgi:Asp-tRNA(Asn)/Glu-tRNA(Gln) amidotransferase A subunit family amidase
MKSRTRNETSRRKFISSLALGSITAAAAPTILRGNEAQIEDITNETLTAAEKIAGLSFTNDERTLLLEDVKQQLNSYKQIRDLEIPNDIPPAMHFLPHNSSMGSGFNSGEESVEQPEKSVSKPAGKGELAFLSACELSSLIRTRQISSLELTRLYLERLEKYDPQLECVITLTAERALEAARKADAEITAGKYRGPLHGIPWGAKDLLAAKGFPTTWGAMPYKEQLLDYDATTVKKLEEAGSILIAKLTLGALAWGDVWFDGVTKNPWNIKQGSSGSSAGPAAATSAGLSGFTIGSETWGSIVSPCTRCGATGLRPTFGRVGRGGAMALSWSMDKLGPIARSVEDCAHIFSAIHGHDPDDPASVTSPFNWKTQHNAKSVKIGYPAHLFEEKRDDTEWQSFDNRTLKTLEKMGYQLHPISLPEFPAGALAFILNVEAATAFDQLTLGNRDDLLVRQIKNAWPNAFRTARYVPAVEYMQANRARTLLMREMEKSIKDVDLYICPSFGGANLLTTNLTGHPAVVLPNGFRTDGTPTSITFMGHLHKDDILMSVANAYQQETDFHKKHPAAFY